ncbi:MAG: 4-vinyl reductase [Synechococcaceae cyanobacterium RL_1_2]|nr:4-vinyl reductase [Synechococcaceae cyanobacterium RL_1_2]
MISIANLVKENNLKGNYYSPDAYLMGDVETGLLENRQGARLIAMPEAFVQGLYIGLNQELGQAAGVVLFRCGYRWGKHFYRRFIEEVSTYYNIPVNKMEMTLFLQCFKECWKTHGWGYLELNFDYYQHGFIVANIKNSAFAQSSMGKGEEPQCFTEAGILSSFFSQLTGKELHCVQTECQTMGAESNYFVIGLEKRVQKAEAWREEGQDHRTIMDRLKVIQEN